MASVKAQLSRANDSLINHKTAVVIAILLTISFAGMATIAAERSAGRSLPGDIFIWFTTIVTPYVLYRRLMIQLRPTDKEGKQLIFGPLCIGYAIFFYHFIQPF
jgi:hypothetical protein